MGDELAMKTLIAMILGIAILVILVIRDREMGKMHRMVLILISTLNGAFSGFTLLHPNEVLAIISLLW